MFGLESMTTTLFVDDAFRGVTVHADVILRGRPADPRVDTLLHGRQGAAALRLARICASGGPVMAGPQDPVPTCGFTSHGSTGSAFGPRPGGHLVAQPVWSHIL